MITMELDLILLASYTENGEYLMIILLIPAMCNEFPYVAGDIYRWYRDEITRQSCT